MKNPQRTQRLHGGRNNTELGGVAKAGLSGSQSPGLCEALLSCAGKVERGDLGSGGETKGAPAVGPNLEFSISVRAAGVCVSRF